MNHYEARQIDPTAKRDDAGKWRYTCMNDGRIWPVGACMHNCPGHDTPEEAYEHERQRLIACLQVGGFARAVDVYLPGKCSCCAMVAKREAFVAGQPLGYTFPVCDKHNSHEHIDPLIQVGSSMSSY